MSKKDSCEIIVLLDRSGSMSSIKTDMEGGFDMFIAEQRKLPGECTVTLAQFDDQYELVYAGKPIADVPNLELLPRGWTALLDAMGRTITASGERLAKLPGSERPERILFLVITDGQENRSREFKREKVLEMVKHQTEKYSWQFVYLGANQDAIAEAGAIGISAAMDFQANAVGTKNLYADVGASTRNYRSTGKYTP